MVDLSSATSPDVGSAGLSTLVVPLGAIEQHGPHLPLATDTIIADSIARRMVAVRDHCGLAPAIGIGASGEHAGFPGTLSIGTDALTTLLVELVRDASRDYARVVVINAHGGNATALQAAKRVCHHEDRRLDVLHCHFPGSDAHAGHTETSVMLHLAPELVRFELAEVGNTSSVKELLPAMRSGGVVAVSPNGVLGDPTTANAAEGAHLVDHLVARLLNALN